MSSTPLVASHIQFPVKKTHSLLRHSSTEIGEISDYELKRVFHWNSPIRDFISINWKMLSCNLSNAKKLKQKPSPQYTSEMIYQNLEAIIKQMLRVWAKESVAIRSVSGIKSGKNIDKLRKYDSIQTMASVQLITL